MIAYQKVFLAKLFVFENFKLLINFKLAVSEVFRKNIFSLLFHLSVWYSCFVDVRKPAAGIVYTCLMVLTAFLSIALYICVWLKIRSTTLSLKKAAHPGEHDMYCSQNGKMVDLQDQKNLYHRTAKIVTLFCLAYIIQVWPFIVFCIWILNGSPDIILVEMAVLFCNAGGVFNFLAYTFFRRMYAKSSTTTADSKTSHLSSKSTCSTTEF